MVSHGILFKTLQGGRGGGGGGRGMQISKHIGKGRVIENGGGRRDIQVIYEFQLDYGVTEATWKRYCLR